MGFTAFVFRHIDLSGLGYCLPEQVEQRGEKQLIVDGDAHVTRFMESWGYRPYSSPQWTPPAQEQKLSCSRRLYNHLDVQEYTVQMLKLVLLHPNSSFVVLYVVR